MRFRSIRYPSALARNGKGPIYNHASPLEADCKQVRRPGLEETARKLPSKQSGGVGMVSLTVLAAVALLALPAVHAIQAKQAARAEACYTLGETIDNDAEMAAFELICAEDYPNV